MQKIIVLLLFLAAYDSPAQGFTSGLLPESQKLQHAYDMLNKNRLSVIEQLKYIDAFPSSQYEFMTVFDPDQRKQLYEAHTEYIKTFRETGSNFPDSIIKKGLQISKIMKWSSGPAELLQHTILTVAAAHPEKFVTWAYTLKRKELDAAVSFLADVETNPECVAYKNLLNALHNIGAYNLEGMLVRAKTNTH